MSNRAANTALLLESLLARRTRAELLDICRAFKIKGASGLRKSKLVGLLCQRLPEVASAKMQCWDEHVYTLVQEIATFSQFHHLGTAVGNPAEDYLIDELLGFVETDGEADYLIIPLEFQELFFAVDGPKYREIVKVNTEIAKLSRGLLHYYGCLPLGELGKMINRLLPYPVDLPRIWAVLREVGLPNWGILSERGYFCDNRLIDLDYLLTQLKTRESLEYRSLRYTEVWQAGDPAFYHKNARQLRSLQHFLQLHRLQESVPYFLDLLFSLVQTDLSPPEIVYALLDHVDLAEEEDVTELAILVFDFYHSVPHWVLKGNSPEEIMERAPKDPQPHQSAGQKKAIVYDFATRQRFNPEAPCPCGSRRSFGHCCGSA